MILENTSILGVWIADLKVHSDSRGDFYESFKFDEISSITGLNFNPVQNNISVNRFGALRGIHYSLAKAGQSKWVTCISGQIFDVVVDIRPDSPTFRKFEIFHLKSSEKRALFIGKGLGHSFVTVEDKTIVSYLVDSPYSPSDEFAINPFDLDIGIDWSMFLKEKNKIILSDKDSFAPSLHEQLINKKLPLLRFEND